MTRIFKITIVSILLLTGCNRAGLLPEREVVAKVGETKLYRDEISSLFTSEMTAADSLSILESYVDKWVKTQLKLQEAELIYGQADSDIEKKVEEYRNSLLSYKFDQDYLERNVDTLITGDDILSYYQSHKSDYVLDRDLVKGRLIKVPGSNRQKARIRELMSSRGEEYQDLVELAHKNNLELIEFNEWVEPGEIYMLLPGGKADQAGMSAKNMVWEIKDGTDHWYGFITQSLREGDPVPVERVSEAISRILYNQRKQEVLRNFEDSIYKAALANSRVEIMIDNATGN